MELDLVSSIILFFVGAAAGIVNVAAGGGSALTLGALIFLGLDEAIANGTNRIFIVIQCLSGVLGFRRLNVSNPRLVRRLVVWAMPGAFLGAWVSTQISNETFRWILIFVLGFAAWSLIFQPDPVAGEEPSDLAVWPGTHPWHRWSHWLYPVLLFGIGFYAGFIQVAVGLLIMGFLNGVLHLDLVRTNAHKVGLALSLAIPSMFIFWGHGLVDWWVALPLAVGAVFGAVAGSMWVVQKAGRGVKVIVAAMIVVIAAKLALEVFL